MGIRRVYSPGQIVFITQVVKDRRRLFNDESMVQLLKRVLRAVHEIHLFLMVAYVFLSDHFHLLIKPAGESNFSQIMHSIKRNFTSEYKKNTGFDSSISLWQKRFWDHVVRDEGDFDENHFHYIHYNPIKHGYVNKLIDWEFSSYMDWQIRGVYGGWNG